MDMAVSSAPLFLHESNLPFEFDGVLHVVAVAKCNMIMSYSFVASYGRSSVLVQVEYLYPAVR